MGRIQLLGLSHQLAAARGELAQPQVTLVALVAAGVALTVHNRVEPVRQGKGLVEVLALAPLGLRITALAAAAALVPLAVMPPLMG
jgi:hypothetical protein